MWFFLCNNIFGTLLGLLGFATVPPTERSGVRDRAERVQQTLSQMRRIDDQLNE